jgi:iron complex transport system substrate-binding protein
VQLVAEDERLRTVRDAVGDVAVPARPERVLPLGFAAVDALIVLGVRPAAAPLHMSHAAGSIADYQRPFLPGIETYSVVDEGLGRILELRPDLILAEAGTPFSLDALRAIAPTVILGSAGAERRLLDVATALGLRARAEAKLAEHAAKMARARRLLAPAAATEKVALLRLHQKQFRLYGDSLGCVSVLFGDLGFTPASLVQRRVVEPGRAESALDEESLSLLDADRIFLYVDPPARERTMALLDRNPVWQSLPAVRAGRVHTVSGAIIWDTILARERIADDVLEAYGQERIFGI